MRRAFPYFILIVLAQLTVGCHKYEDDSFLLLKRPFKRLKGEWGLSKYEINGVDSTETVKASCIYDKINFSYVKTPEGIDDLWFFAKNTSGCQGEKNGSWYFQREDKLVLTYSDSSFFSQSSRFPLGGNAIWDIKKLSHGDLWLETIFNGQTHRVEFQK